jgi:exopolysaccharide/PEP-CTERM locus tyrosine autokinase
MSVDQPRLPEGGSLAERVAGRLSAAHAAPAVATPRQAPATLVPVPEAAPGNPPVEAFDPASAPLQINFARLQAAGFITPQSPRTSNTESVRVIKRHLLKAVFPGGQRVLAENNDNVIMVTSAMPEEGKTFISLNLAMSFCAERDLFVLLIDGDGHRQSLGVLLGATGEPGLVDILADKKLRVGDLIQRTNIRNLSFLSGGRSQANSTESLASKNFGLLMRDIAARYPDRIIIIDTPPVLASTEAVALSGCVGHTVVVVQQDRTSKRQLQRTLEMLEGARNVGCILNMVPPEESFAGYGY